MTALNDGERELPHWTTERAEQATPMPVELTALQRTKRCYPTWLPPRRFIAAVIALGGVQLMATMEGPVGIVALPKIQNELGLSDAGAELGDHRLRADLWRANAAWRPPR